MGSQRLHLGQPVPRVGQLGLDLGEAPLQLIGELLQLDDPLDAGQVDTLILAQPLDLAQQATSRSL